jgi:hypothetical protein
LPKGARAALFRRVGKRMQELFVESESKAEIHLSAYVALTVVIISVFLAMCTVKDSNLVDAMIRTDMSVHGWGST